MEIQDRKTVFFEEFVKRLIIISYQNISNVNNLNMFEAIEKRALIPPVIAIQNRLEKKPMHEPPIEYKEVKHQPIQYQEIKSQPPLEPLPNQIRPIIKEETIPQRPFNRESIPVMNRLIPILADPLVQSINCPGPEKNILITRRGIIQHTSTSFTTGEINDFMKEVSEKTKIPLLTGLFKVVYDNLIITAVISEFVGTKFLVEKRIPQTLPVMPGRVQFK